ncbi:MAG: hypothetical protein JKY96_06075 [Phycisphaerales bacterium]|nr:hypothetical protein [Phycisphaerales bacterium]
MNRHNKGNTEDARRARPKANSADARRDAEVKPSKSEDDVLSVIEGVEQQLGALRTAHAEHRKAMSDLSERRRAIEDLADELESRESELGSREVELAEMRQDFEQRECNLVQRAQGLEQQESKIAVQAEALEKKETKVESGREQVQARLVEIDDQLVGLSNQKKELATIEEQAIEKLAREEVAAGELVVVKDDLKHAEGKLRGREIELKNRSKALEELAEQTGTLDSELNETKQTLANAIAQAKEHMVREQKVNEGLRAQLEQLADSGADAKELEEKSELLRVQLEEASWELGEVRNGAKKTLQIEQEKLGELREQLDGAKQQTGVYSEQIAASNAEVKRLGEDLKMVQGQLADAPTSGALDKANATIKELRDQISEVGMIADEELTAERTKVAGLDKQIGDLRSSLDAMVKDRDAAKSELGKRADLDQKEFGQIQERLQKSGVQIKKLSTQLEEVAAKYQKLRADSAQQSKQGEATTQKLAAIEEQAKSMRATIKQLTEDLETERNEIKGVEADEWNALRRQRLGKLRSVLKANSDKIRLATDALCDRYDQCESVLLKRAELAEAYEAVAEAQAKYAKRETRSGVFLGMAGLGLLMFVLATISWFASGRITPGEYAARVTIVANAGDRILSDADLESWGGFMEALPEDPQFIEFAAERMKRRGIAKLGIPGELRNVMRGSLDVSSATPGTVEFEYRGAGSERSKRVLETFAVALSSAANNARARRSDGATSMIPGDVVVGTEPLDNKRLEMAGMVFGGSMLTTLLFGGILWSRLSAAKSRFERDSRIEPLLDESQWQMPGT